MKKINIRGQLSIVNIIFFLILVAVVAVINPIIGSFIDTSIASNNYSATSLLLMNNITAMVWIGVIITFFLYVTPIRPQQY